MKKTIAIFLCAMLLLTACHPTDVDPAGSTAPETVQPTQETTVAVQPTEEATQPTFPAQPDPEWLVKDPFAGSFRLDQEYNVRAIPIHWSIRTGDEVKVYSICFDGDGLLISSDSDELYRVPGSDALEGYTLLGANGKSAYLRNDTALLEVDLLSGAVTPLLTDASLISNVYLCDGKMLYYAAHSDGETPDIQILCVYRGEERVIVSGISSAAEAASLFTLHRPLSPSSCITWTQINPEMLTRLKAELGNPKSVYKTAEYSDIWGDLSTLTDPGRRWQIEKLCYQLQQDTDIPALLTVSKYPQSDTYVEETPTFLGSTDWMTERTPLSYEEYFSLDRPYSSSNLWIGTADAGNKQYELCLDYNTQCLHIEYDGEVCATPWFSALYPRHQILGCDGRFAYLRSDYSSEVLQLDMFTHTEKTLVSCDQLLQVYLCDKDVLVYSAVVDGQIGIYRLYIPEMKLDLLYDDFAKDTPASWFELRKPASSQGNLVWTMINPEMLALLQAELADPNSPFQMDGSYDMSVAWELPDPFTSHKDLMEIICLNVQTATNVRAFVEGTYNCGDGSYSERFGIIDNCWIGTGYMHDHFNPEVTHLDDPVPCVGQWTELADITLPEAATEDPLYEKYDYLIVDETIVMQQPESDTQHILYTAADSDLSYLCYGNGMLYFWDGDIMYQLDIQAKSCRTLLTYAHTESILTMYFWSTYFKDDSKNTVYIEVAEGLFNQQYLFHADTGELEKIHFI